MPPMQRPVEIVISNSQRSENENFFCFAHLINNSRDRNAAMLPPNAISQIASVSVAEGLAGSAEPMMNWPAGISTKSNFTPRPRSMLFVAGMATRAA